MAKGTTIRMWRRSLLVLIFIIVAGFGLIVFRLIDLQIVQGADLQKRAVDQQLADTTISAQRGTIYDRNMKVLAQSANVWTVVLEPAYLDDDEIRNKVADGLSQILGMDRAKLYEETKKKSYYDIIARKVESDVKDKILQFKKDNKIASGIRLIEDYKRYYPYGSFAASVLGFTGTDNQGLSGLEAYYDKYLTGTPGRLITAKNAIGTDMPFQYEQMVEAKNGNSLVLSIDETIQHFLEKNLEQGILDNKVSNRAAAIMMDVKTGAILGLAVKGDFDPNDPFTIADPVKKAEVDAALADKKDALRNQYLQDQWRNKAVSDTYEPGSVFKMVTASAALDEGLFKLNSTFYCGGSVVATPGTKPINCWRTSGHGSEDFTHAVMNSCNVAFVQMGLTIGPERFFKYFSSFGMTEKTGIDLPGESGSIYHNVQQLNPVELATSSFGQTFTVTPIQMITAVAAVANGGYLVQPHVVQQIVDDNGNIVKSADTTVKRQVISSQTSADMRGILEQNAKSGTAKNGYVAGYRIAGKTGTSEKITENLQSTTGKNYIASYCGFAPADDPQVALLVFFDEPHGDSYYGSAVAGPVFKRIMEDALPYLGVERRYTEAELSNIDVATPPTVGKTKAEAQGLVKQAGLTVKIEGSGDTVVEQIPEPGKQIPKNGTVVLYTDQQSAKTQTTVPKLTGLSLTDVNKAAANAGINIVLSGAALTGSEGCVSYSQSVAQGTQVQPGTVVTVEFMVKDEVR